MNELLWIVLTSVILTLFFDTPFGNIKKLLFKGTKAIERKSEVVDGDNDKLKNVSNESKKIETMSEVGNKEM